ncbi:HpcH/HpaI aldolase family protein [Microvirga antarctica]|uniref:HpcH/HpaI aldolase family protein n=1 Tax=Microvirga antarctica TaxID=2819233 RepID=UPI001B30163D|nr:aldolase/citrate lyase family protein [Microvirga antarctica]
MALPFKERLAKGEPVFGSFAFLASPDIVEIMGLAGFDYVIIDLEHSPKDWSAVANMIRAAELHGMAALIRVRENSEKSILEALELGAAGIVLPFVQSADDIVRAARAMNYPPRGMRGTCTLTRAARYGGVRATFLEHSQQQNERVVLIAQIEDKLGVDNIQDILACEPGIDALIVGRSDLASSLGRPGQVEDPLVLAATDQVIRAARLHKRAVPSGIGLYSPQEAGKWVEAGVGLFFYSADSGMMVDAARTAAQAFKASLAQHTARVAAE